jgi:mono/diheme cytochrome c family protein
MRRLAVVALLMGLAGCDRGSVGSEPISRCYPTEAACDQGMFRSGVKASQGDAERGGELYKGFCARCHGPAGVGMVADTRGLDFTSPVWHARYGDGEIASIVTNGRLPKMPPHSFTDAQMADLIAHVRGLKKVAERKPEERGY